jgi:hypothetical protein
MNVDTPSGSEPWRDVEMTGYIKIISINSSSVMTNSSSNGTGDSSVLTAGSPPADESEIKDTAWYARGRKRNNGAPCEGTAYFGGLHPEGTGSWKKLIRWTGGYTEERFRHKVLNEEMIGKWIGWNIYNIEISNITALKMESYLDINNNGSWSKFTDFVDSGGWYARTPEAEFYSARCGKPKDYIVTNSGSIATFRADNMVLDFRDLSIREIQPSSNLTFEAMNTL